MLKGYIARRGKTEYLARRNPYGGREFSIYAYDAAIIEKRTDAEEVIQRIAKPGEKWELRFLDKIEQTEEIVKAWP